MRPFKGQVAKSVQDWAEVAKIDLIKYVNNAIRLGYPIKSAKTVIPKHWHDDIKKEFRP